MNKLLVNFLFPPTDYLKPGTPFKNLNRGRVSNIISNIIGKTIVSSYTGFLEVFFLNFILVFLDLRFLTFIFCIMYIYFLLERFKPIEHSLDIYS